MSVGRHEYYEEIFSCKPLHELTKWFMNALAPDGVRDSSLVNAGAIPLRFAKKCRRAADIERRFVRGWEAHIPGLAVSAQARFLGAGAL
jgi:hypothetical protein